MAFDIAVHSRYSDICVEDLIADTKYFTLDSKRLPCAKSIPAGILGHHGPHSHSLDEDPFHYCETR